MNTRTALAFIVVSAFTAAGGCAAQDSSQLLAPEQMGLIKSTCQDVMHIGHHNAVDLAACMQSLSDTLASKRERDIAWQSDADCEKQGLARDTSAFSMCVLDKQNSYAARSPQSSAPSQLVYDLGKDSSAAYYSSSFDTNRRREQYSCAQLGLDPATNAFGQCVADLDADLFNADHPNP